MDVDSSMVSETDQDPGQNHEPPVGGAISSEGSQGELQLVGAEQSAGSVSPQLQPQPSQVQLQQQSTQTQTQQSQVQPASVAGPRPAPAYTVVNAIIEKKEDGPGSRCGHTLTAVAAVGEEGTPGYIGPRLILFGGATALEGNPAASGPPSPAGGAGIRLAGATADVHCYDVLSNKWSRLTPLGEQPSPRAAHVATAVGTMVVIQGGIGPAGLSAEDLHVLDLTTQRPRWHRVVVQGPGPGPRYGHVMALVGQRFLLAIGGNDGKRPLADVWALDTAAKPYEWRKLEPEGEGPPPCMYATASARSDGLLLLCGGRDANSVPLASAYGLAKHRDGRWEWAIAPGVSPSPRYQHAAVFVNARLHVSGGALGGGRMVEDCSSVAVLDTAAGVWCDTKGVVTSPRIGRYSADAAGGDAAVELTRRCRHAAAAVGDLIFIYGGLRGGVLLDDLLAAEDLAAAETTNAASAAAAAAANIHAGRLASRCGFSDERTRQTMPESVPDGAVVLGNPVAPPINGDMYTDISTENAMLQGPRRLTKGVESLVEASAAEAEAISAALAAAKARQVNGDIEQMPDRDRGAEATPSEKQISTLIKMSDSNLSNNVPPAGVRLHHRAVVVAAETGGALGGMVRQLSIDQFENEGRRVSYGTPENATAARKLLDRQMSINSVPKKVIAHLLKPRGWKPPVRRQFFLDCNEIADLCDGAERIFSNEPSVLQIRAPVKIFGDLHGQFGDLMRLFDEYGSPSTAGDVAYIDYLFLGDYVDRGQHSLETITLLLALKVEYPHNVHLIRGNHEAADINALFGFRIECIERMGERDGIWAWHRINRLFNWLPLAALIEKKIICMHGGIGRSINHVEQIENIQRPITMEAGSVVLMDLLWSDPTENDSVEGLRPNARGPGLVTFGPDRVMEFCNNNDLQLIVRAHECVMDGFERFAQGHLITLFSATNYCGTANNAGAILVLGRDLVVVPKLIHPLPPAISSPETSPEHIEDTWMQELNANRPPTPTRGRPQVANDRGSLPWI
ncbi:hypothetical protein NE237_008332 [Protea cynaroides]|uniref:Serine/threonine-protein phosphatase n=1 Tax=Protea cynaroides TaxID=273540 RepID=A0A9Q0KVN7_9MAGN|nr:hypothetical protein NE237_008332 [Protea cynaroides]